MRFLIAFALIAWSPVARAQGIMLPKLDSINVYGQVGDFEGKDAVDAHTFGPFGTYGWGFETAFTVAASASHVVELAVGYDQLFQHAKFVDGFVLDGEIRSLPSVSAYVSFPNNLYVGIGTGLVSMANATVDDGNSRFAISGDTLDLAPKVGYAISLQPGSSIADRRVNAFVEADYHVRYFGGLTYGFNAPADLPSRIYLGGFTVASGIQITLDPTRSKPKEPAPDPPKNPPAKPADTKK